MARHTKELTGIIASRENTIWGFNNFFGMLPNPDPVLKALGQDIRAYRDLRSDPLIGSAVRRRKAAVKSLEHGFNQGDTDTPVCAFLRDMMSGWDLNAIISRLLDAPLYGWQPAEVMWQADNGRWTVTDIIAKPQEWFSFDTENQLRFKAKYSGIAGMALPPYKFICPAQDADYDNPYGFPDLSMCFWASLFKKHGWRFWMTFTEKYGTPWVVAKHSSGQKQDIDPLLDALHQMIQDAVTVIPDNASVQIIEPGGKGVSSEIYKDMIVLARSEISIALLGQNQTTEADTNHASATAGLQVTNDIRDGDATLVCSAINQVLRRVVDLNFGDVPCPVWSMWEQEQVDQIQAQRDLTLSQTRAFFTDAYYQREYGLQPGDLQPYTAVPPVPFTGGQVLPSLSFAEPAIRNDEQARDTLDEVLDTLAQGTAYSGMAEPLLAPLFEAVKEGAAPDQLLGQLAEIYPQMNSDALTEKLTRLLFVAKILGREHAQ